MTRELETADKQRLPSRRLVKKRTAPLEPRELVPRVVAALRDVNARVHHA